MQIDLARIVLVFSEALGENLYLVRGGRGNDSKFAEGATSAWYNEVSAFHYHPKTFHGCKDKEKIGHLTQVCSWPYNKSYRLTVSREKGPFLLETSWDRPKSAPYLRLKNSKRTSKCQVFSFTVSKETQKFNQIGAPFRIFFNIHSVANYQKNWRGPFGGKIFEKSLTMPKKLNGGPFSLAQYCMLRGKEKPLCLVQFI